MLRDLCAVAKLGKRCPDDLCHGADVTLCGFDDDLYHELTDEYFQQDDDENGAAGE